MAKKTTTTIQDSRRAAMDFLRAGRKNERKQKAASSESGFELASRFDEMSDEEFDEGVANGTITPEQIRKAGEYKFDVYMGDVWIENPDNDDKPEPTYEQFMSNPSRYGFDNPDEHIERYNPNRNDATDSKVEAMGVTDGDVITDTDVANAEKRAKKMTVPSPVSGAAGAAAGGGSR